MNYSDLPRETLEQMLRQTQAELKHEMHESNILAVRLAKQKKAFRTALKLIAILMKETYNG
jgi:dsDNA-binding SOS-regulon protein